MSLLISSKAGTVHQEPFNNMYFSEKFPPNHTFSNTGDFLDYYRQTFLEADVCTEEWIDDLLSPLSRDAQFTFSHGDLVPKNIMVDPSSGTITGIIDWATGGFYPSYWEYCYMHNPSFMTPGWDYVLSQVFPGERRTKEILAVRKLLSVWETCFFQ